MTQTHSSLLAEILPPEERSIEGVVARYQRVAGAVTRLARTLTGREQLRVVLGSSSRANRDEVVINPGLFQAAYGRRAPVTPEETALASALHEVIHLVSTDLDEARPIPEEWTQNASAEEEVGEQDEDAPDWEQVHDLLESDGKPLPLLDALLKAGGPVAEALFFAVEDARQELQNLTDYPGARSVLEDLYTACLHDSLQQRMLSVQCCVSCFMLVGSYINLEDLRPKVHSKVAEALDESLPLLRAVAQAQDPWEVAGLTLQLLEKFQSKGLVSSHNPPARSQKRPPLPEEEKAAMTHGLDQVRLFSPVVADAENYHQTHSIAQAMSADNSEQTGAANRGGEEGVDQLLTVSQSPTVYLPTGQSGKLVAGPVPETFRGFALQGRQALLEAARRWEVNQRQVSGELFPLFVANQRRGLRSGYDAGDLSPYAALLLGGGLYERMFERRSRPSRRSYAVSVLVDGSASMLQPRQLAAPQDRNPWGMAAAMLGAWTLAAMCHELQVSFEVAIFNRAFAARVDDTEWSYSRRRSSAIAQLRQSHGDAAHRLTSTVNHYLLSTFDQPWRRNQDVLAGLFWAAARTGEANMAARRHPRETAPVSMFENAANVDEYNLSYAAQRLRAHGARVPVMVVLADGMTRGSVQNLAQAVEEIDGLGITVLGIGVGDDTVVAAYPRHQIVSRPNELTGSMVEGVRTALRRGLALFGEDRGWSGASRAATWDGFSPVGNQSSRSI